MFNFGIHLKKLLIPLLLFYVFNGCKPESFTTRGEDMLELSTDTIVFDTILMQLYQGTPKSVNRQFLVKNPHDEKIKTTIALAGGAKSQFRLNVDGSPGTFFEAIEIRPHDSVFVFVEAYANPNLDPSGNPLIIRDSIVFQTNGNIQDVKLIAWGQDANYFMQDSTDANIVWSDKTKPYVIYDYFYIKPGGTLTIKEGVKVYFAPYSRIYTEGTLKIEGTTAEPVIMEGDRTSDKNSDKYTAFKYYNVPGQWFGLWYAWPTKGNTINNLRLKNSTVAIYLDSSSSDGKATVKLENAFIQNTTYSSIRGTRSKVEATNCIFANSGSASVYTFKGGDYDLRHCTISGYSDFGGGKDPAVYVTNRLRDEFNRVIETYPISFRILNSIVYGDTLVKGDFKDEIVFDIDNTQTVTITPANCVFKTKNVTLGQSGTGNILNKNPKWKDMKKYFFNLDTLSSAKDIGLGLNPGVGKDILGNNRDTKPDAGAFERIE